MKNTFRIFYFMLFLLLVSCNVGGDQTAKGGGSLVISTSLASIYLDQVYKHLGQGDQVDKDAFATINIDSQKLANLLKQNGGAEVKVSISLADANQKDLLTLNGGQSVVFSINRKSPEKSFPVYLRPRDLKAGHKGGKVTLVLAIQTGNQKVVQTSTQEITVAQRTITLVDPKGSEYVHILPDEASSHDQPLTITVNSDSLEDSVYISWAPADTNYIQPNDGNNCSVTIKNGVGSCTVHYNIMKYDHIVVANKYNINAHDSAEPTVTASLPIKVGTSTPKLELTAESSTIDTDASSAQMHVKLLGKFTGEVKATMVLSGNNPNKLRHNRRSSEQWDINNYVEIEPKVVTLVNGSADMVVKFKDGITPSDISDNVGAVFTVLANSNTPEVDSSEVVNIINGSDDKVQYVRMFDANDEKHEHIVENVDITNGATQIFDIIKHRLDMSHVEFAIQDSAGLNKVKDKIEITWDHASKLTIHPDDDAVSELTSYFLVATLDGVPIPINGKIMRLPVNVSPKLLPEFLMMPNEKQVLTDYPSHYYIKVDNKASISNHQFKLRDLKDNTKLILYVDDLTSPGCKDLVLNQVNVNEAGDPSLGASCNLSTSKTVSDNPCVGSLNADMKLDKSLIFKVKLPDSYKEIGKTCQINLRVGNYLFKNVHAKMSSVTGFNPIIISANSGSTVFNNAHRIEMCATKTSDYSGCPLNKQFVTTLNGDNLRNNSLFSPASMFEIDSSYFDTGTDGSNTFTLRNYPGRNMLGQKDASGNDITTLNLPQVNLILGYSKPNNTWWDDRCPIGTSKSWVVSNIGCDNKPGGTEGSYTFGVKGVSFIPANNLVVTADQVNVNGGNNNLYVDSGWETDGWGIKNHSMRANGGFAVLFDLH